MFERTVAYQYNLNGDIEKIVERDSSDTSFFYNLTRVYTYNAKNQLEQITADEFNDGSIDRITDIAFDTNNYLAKSSLYLIKVDEVTNNKVKELRETFEYSYDAQGNVIKVIDSAIDYGSVRTTNYVYDNQKNIIRKTTLSAPTVIDVEVFYNSANLATSSTAKYSGFNTNVQGNTDKAQYNTAGYLIRSQVDVSQDGKIDQEITYSYQGNILLKFNIAPFLNLGESYNIAPTAIVNLF